MTKLKKARLLNEITQTKLASLTGMHQSQISLIERGKIKPSPEQLEAFHQAFTSPEPDG